MDWENVIFEVFLFLLQFQDHSVNYFNSFQNNHSRSSKSSIPLLKNKCNSNGKNLISIKQHN